MDGSRRTVAWLDPAQVALVRAVADAAELELVGAGSSARGQSGHVAAELDTRACDDLRATLASVECDLIWIASPGRFGAAGAPDDATAVAAARERGVRLATLEPIPASALDLDAGGWTGESRPLDAARPCPLWRDSSALRAATEHLPQFGAIGTLAIESWSGPGEGSLGAHLYTALELVLLLLGEPETIEAAYVSSATGRAVHALPGESLRDLAGDLSATMRFADGRAACLAASDRAGRWNRAATLVGPGGRLRIADDTFEWIGPSGEALDQSPKRRRGGLPAKTPPAVAAMAMGLFRVLEPPADEPPAPEPAAILAVAQAALLSCRTGQGESPSTIRRMVGAA